jgi:hypothetical protein
MTAVEDTREAWLGRASARLANYLLSDQDVPPLRISVGWPGGSSNRKTTIGQCWPTGASADGVNQIFMSPVRGEDDTVKVLATLLHEMIHAVDDCASGHRGRFSTIAKSCGFTRPLTSSDNHTDELTAKLEEIAELVGPFPHAAISSKARAADTPPKQETRMIKLVCPYDDYSVRTTRTWLDVGLPTCPCGTEMQEAS